MQSQTTSSSNEQSRGIALILTAAVFFSAMYLVARLAGDSFRADTLVLYRMIFQTLVLLPWIKRYLEPHPKFTMVQRLRSHLWRGLFGVASMLFLFKSFQYLPIALSTLMAMTSIIWASAIAWVFLGERPAQRQFLWAGLTVIGIVLGLMGQGAQHWTYHPRGIFYGLCCGLSMGLALVTLRGLRKEFDTFEIVFYFGVCGIVCMLPYFVLHPEFPKTGSQAALLLGVGFFGTMGQLLMTSGFKHTPTMIATLCNLQQTPLNIIVGLIFLGEVPPPLFYVGVLLAIGGMSSLAAVRPRFVSLPKDL